LPGRPHGGDRAFSACAFVGAKGRLTASARVQLLPAGEFRSLDGRPTEVSAWFIDGAIAATLIAAAAARETPYVLDYHHQSLLAAEQGLKAPAAGWFKTLEWVEGVGLFATDVQWTDAARQMVEADELRYVSPVFAWDRETGQVTHLINAALTNTPGLDGMTAVAERVAAALSGLVISTLESTMDDLIDRLRYFLNLPITATAEDCTAELQKLIEQIDTLPPPEFSAASLTLGGRLLAALSAAWVPEPETPDPAQYVPMAMYLALQGELSAARLALEGGQHAALMQAALADGRILPATETYWRGQPLTTLSAYLEQAQPIAALTGMQSAGQPPSRPAVLTHFTPMAGYAVDAERLALHQRALAHASDHRCSYAQALSALQS
jgi:phage I-like protein